MSADESEIQRRARLLDQSIIAAYESAIEKVEAKIREVEARIAAENGADGDGDQQ